MNKSIYSQSGNYHRMTGTVLIVTIWVVLILAGLALVFADSMRVAAIVAANHVASLKAEAVAAGAIEYIKSNITTMTEDQDSQTDESLYQAVEIGDSYFWILHSNLEDDEQFAYGLTDEAGKINLNSASEEMLLRLPGMTSELAASIIDWRDEDSEITTGGAEDEYYLMQSEPYNCKNAPLETVDEILLIKGASEDLLYGEDTNLNGVLDDNENDGDDSEPDDNANGRLECGFYDYVTVYSVESNLDADGEQRININNSDARSQLQSLFDEKFKEERSLAILDRIPTNPSFENILDFYYSTEMELDEFEQIVDSITTSDEETVSGLVNVNTASKEVLLCLTDMEDNDAEALISYRDKNDELDSIAWVTEVLEREKAIGIGSYITTRSFQYSADIVCLSGNGRGYKRYKGIFDVQSGAARIVYWKSLTHSGWPLNKEIVSTLRKGQPFTNSILGMN